MGCNSPETDTIQQVDTDSQNNLEESKVIPDENEVNNKEKVDVEKNIEIVPWEDFFEECKAEYSKSIFLANKNYYTDKCEKEYAKEFNLPEYCEKIADRDESENCWLALALQNNDINLCTPLKPSGTSADSPYKRCKNRVTLG